MTVRESGRTPVSPPRAFWSDVRFLLGIVLVLASVAGVWFVVAVSRQTAPVFAATRTIVPGEMVGSEGVRLVEVALGQLSDTYLNDESLAEGLVATRTIESGELIPVSAVGGTDEARMARVVLRSASAVPSSVDSGSVVEVWAAPLIERGVYDVPRILIADAIVVSVTRDDSMIGGGADALEVVIDRADVALTLAAMADGSALSVVPTSVVKR